MVKILQLCAVDFTAYHFMRPLGAALREAGCDVTFSCSAGRWLDMLRDEGFGVAAIPIARSVNVAHHARSLAALVRFMRRERFDIVHAHTPVAGLVGRTAAKLAGVRGLVYTVHGFYFHDRMGGASRSFFAGLERCAAAVTDIIFLVSEEDRNEAIKLKIAPPEKLVYTGNGVDPTRFDKTLYPREAAEFKAAHTLGAGPVVGFIGRTVREKGTIEFVHAAAMVRSSFPDAKFVMVGEPLRSDRDNCWSEVMRLRDELDLTESLILTGYREDVPAVLAAFDLFVLPSYREGMPVALLEAMATGLPVVATAIRGCREAVLNGETGILVPPRNHRALAGAMRRILSSKESMERMGAKGRSRVLARFDERKIIAQQIEHISRLAREKLGKRFARSSSIDRGSARHLPQK